MNLYSFHRYGRLLLMLLMLRYVMMPSSWLVGCSKLCMDVMELRAVVSGWRRCGVGAGRCIYFRYMSSSSTYLHHSKVDK